MDVELTRHERALVARPSARWLDAQTAPELHSALAAQFAEGASNVVVDLSEVVNLDSAGIGTAIRLLRLVPEGGRLVFAGVRPAVRELFQKSRVDHILVCFDSAADALASFGPP